MKSFFQLLTTCVLLLSCGFSSSCADKEKGTEADEHELDDSVAVNCYMLLPEEKYDEYVRRMYSCDGTTEKYRQNMRLYLKEHKEKVDELRKGVKSAAVVRKEMHKGGTVAHVFINVTYGDGTTEEILFPMVYDGEKWRIQ